MMTNITLRKQATQLIEADISRHPVPVEPSPVDWPRLIDAYLAHLLIVTLKSDPIKALRKIVPNTKMLFNIRSATCTEHCQRSTCMSMSHQFGDKAAKIASTQREIFNA